MAAEMTGIAGPSICRICGGRTAEPRMTIAPGTSSGTQINGDECRFDARAAEHESVAALLVFEFYVLHDVRGKRVRDHPCQKAGS